MLITVKSALSVGLETIGVDVELHVARAGLPSLDIVGLAGKAVSESKQRVKAAIVNAGFQFPKGAITVNLAPGDVPKEGAFYDLPIAVGVLHGAEDAAFEIPESALFYGELSLDGSLRHTKGALLMALHAKDEGITELFVPKDSANEAAIISGVNVYPVSHLRELVAHLAGITPIAPAQYVAAELAVVINDFDLTEVVGQEQAKRALEIAAAGGHNILMVGSPGAGKTMLARALSGILPEMAEVESLEVTKIYSISGMIPPQGGIVRERPFRAPHHTISSAGLIGGGSKVQPGEISLSHRGVLFLDEFNEFPRQVIESMRQPMEDGHLTVSRSRERVTYPARFMLAASANPCPCGFLFDAKKPCLCTDREIERYRKRVSGPIMDRIDLHVDVAAVDIEKLSQRAKSEKSGETSAIVRDRVTRAREKQVQRFAKAGIRTNAEMRNKHIAAFCALTPEVNSFLTQGAKSFDLSARSFYKMIKIARTIADLDESAQIESRHMCEALQYRPRFIKNKGET
jgi:magnesium chelatase family protein